MNTNPLPPPPLPATPSTRSRVIGALPVVIIAGFFLACASAPKTDPPTSAPGTYLTPVAPTTAATYVPTPADFTIEIVELSRSCFGSAGCNITYKINPTYSGQPTDPTVTYTVVYSIAGASGDKSDNFTMKGTQAKVPTEDFISTPPNPTLTATVT